MQRLELPAKPPPRMTTTTAADGTKTIAEIESDLATALEALRDLDSKGTLPEELKPLLRLTPPVGGSVHVSLRHREKGRQIRRSFQASAFQPKTCGAWLVFEAPLEERDGEEKDLESTGSPMEDLLRALALAEAEPHLSFVSLKWFRDTYLPKCGFPWALDSDQPRRMLMEATARGLVITAKVANPKTPAFPVATVKLNRSHGEVDRILTQR